MKKNVIKVDKEDKKIGEIEKLEAHQDGILHRAFSIFILNDEGEMLLQKRADQKYHAGGLWTNACCSHPTEETDLKEQAKKRLREEMGFETEIGQIDIIPYRAEVGDLIENEIDHIFIGIYNGNIKPNPDEVSDYKWISLDKLEQDLEKNSEKYTPWFKILYPQVVEKLIL
jgi:isopentenyl-diphosphate delta-isomerase